MSIQLVVHSCLMLKGKIHAKITQFRVQSGSSGPTRASANALQCRLLLQEPQTKTKEGSKDKV